MTLEKFRALAEAWGADIDRWPERYRADAMALAASPEASAILAAERRTDAALSRRPDVSPDRASRVAHGVTLRIAQASDRQTWWQSIVPSNWLVPVGSLACSAALGIGLALALPSPASDAGDTLVLAKIFDSTSMLGGLEVR